jgi:hypothetical protein
MSKHLRPYQRIRGVKRDDQVALDRAKDAKAYAEYLLFRAPAAEALLVRVAKMNGYVELWPEGAKFLISRFIGFTKTSQFIAVRWREANGVMSTGVSRSEVAGEEYGLDEIEAAIEAAIHAYELRLDYGQRYGM